MSQDIFIKSSENNRNNNNNNNNNYDYNYVLTEKINNILTEKRNNVATDVRNDTEKLVKIIDETIENADKPTLEYILENTIKRLVDVENLLFECKKKCKSYEHALKKKHNEYKQLELKFNELEKEYKKNFFKEYIINSNNSNGPTNKNNDS